MNIWFNAALDKYRFESSKGLLLTEDLFDLKMEELDVIYQNLTEKLESLAGKSLYDKEAEDEAKKEAKKTLKDMIKIVESVFNYHKAKKEKAQKRAKAKAMKDDINSVIAQKQKDELASMPIEQLKEIRDSL